MDGLRLRKLCKDIFTIAKRIWSHMIDFNMTMSAKAEFLHKFQTVASFPCLIFIKHVNKNSPYNKSWKWDGRFRFSLLTYSCICLDELCDKIVLQIPTAALNYDPSKSMNTQTNLMSKWKTVTSHVNPEYVIKARRISTNFSFWYVIWATKHIWGAII